MEGLEGGKSAKLEVVGNAPPTGAKGKTLECLRSLSHLTFPTAL